MPRTFKEVLEAMRSVAKGDADAQRLVTRFRKQAIDIEWNPEDPFDPGKRYHLPLEPRYDDPLFVVLLHDDACAPEDDVIAWYHDVTYGAAGRPGQALFVDGTPCHTDWFGLKVVNEVGFMELELFVERVVGLRAATYGCNKALLRKVTVPLSLPMLRNHHALVSRLIDRRMHGRITDRVRALKSSMDPAKDAELAKRRLCREITNLLPLTWPEPVNGEEQLVREGLINSAATHSISRLLEPVVVPD